MTEKIKVQNYDIICSETDMNIINSYKISNIEVMKYILNISLDETKIYKTNRSMNSLLNEWISHNILYELHICRKHTKDCNFESKQKIGIKLFYFILGSLGRILSYIF